VHKSLSVKSSGCAVPYKRSSASAFSDVQLTISGCNALALALGRVVFLPAIRDKVRSRQHRHFYQQQYIEELLMKNCWILAC
jgi:photosystem I subunit V